MTYQKKSVYKKPFIVKKGYKRILCLGHPRTDGKGYVREHIMVMEFMIGRHLLLGEEVHHKDFNSLNNDPINLQLCATHADHLKLHREGRQYCKYGHKFTEENTKWRTRPSGLERICKTCKRRNGLKAYHRKLSIQRGLDPNLLLSRNLLS